MNNSNRRVFIKRGVTGVAGLIVVGRNISNGGNVFQGNDYNILDFGAIGDGKIMNTKSIQKTIDNCWQKGGGRVIVPRGIYLTGGIILRSNIEFHVEDGAVLLGSPYMKDYIIRELLSEARYSKYLRYALVFAQGSKNITVSGNGFLNGNAIKGGDLEEFADKGGTVHERPCLLWFDECENILVKDITYTNAAGWTETYSRCRNIHVDNITVKDNYFFNADGCNMLDCKNFIIENCDINTLDDGICLKGYTQDGCRNGIIRNNKVRSICNGIKMGTDSSGGFRDVLIENNIVWQTGISGLALEITDGGIMENIIVRNITMNVVATPIFIMLSNRNRPIYGQLTIPNGSIRDVHIEGINATVDKAIRLNEMEKKHFNNLIVHTSSITGYPEKDIENITIANVDIIIKGGFPVRTVEDTLNSIPEAGADYPENRMFGVLPAYGFYIRHVRNLLMKNISIKIERQDGRPTFFLNDVHDSVFSRIEVNNIKSTPTFSINKNCSEVQLQ